MKSALAKHLMLVDGKNPLAGEKKGQYSTLSKKETKKNQKPPTFIATEERWDKNKRRPSDPEYDPTSVYIS